MHKEPITILAINPGTRYLGIAVFRGPELLDWGVKVVGRGTPKEMRSRAIETISQLMDTYQPKVLALKRLHPARSSKTLNRLADDLARLARGKGLEVCRYSIDSVKALASHAAQTNKRQLAEIVASEHPILQRELERERSHRNQYHIRMFEAVALGSVCFRQMEGRHRN